MQAALPSLRGKLVLVETDNKATRAYVNRESPGWSVSLPQQHRPSTVEDVLQQQHPPLGGTPSRKGQPKGRSLIKMAKGSLGYSAPSRLLSEGSRSFRSSLCGRLRHKTQSAAPKIRLVEARSGVNRDGCLHVPAQGREPLLFSSGGMHSSAPSRG